MNKEIIGPIAEYITDQVKPPTQLFIDHIIQNQYKLIVEKKDKFIREMIIKKGYAHILEGLGKRRFTGICVVEVQEWEYWYVNDGTFNGAFIVATQKIRIVMEEPGGKEIKQMMSMGFDWNETEPDFLNNQ